MRQECQLLFASVFQSFNNTNARSAKSEKTLKRIATTDKLYHCLPCVASHTLKFSERDENIASASAR